MEPIKTREKGHWTMESMGRTVEVTEIIEMDYGKQGKTRVRMLKADSRPVDYAAIDAVARLYGHRLVMPEGIRDPSLRSG